MAQTPTPENSPPELTVDQARRFQPDADGNLVARAVTMTHIVTAIRAADGSAMVVQGDSIDAKGNLTHTMDFIYKVERNGQISVRDEQTKMPYSLDIQKYLQEAKAIAADFSEARTNDGMLDIREANKLSGHGLNLNAIVRSQAKNPSSR